MEKKIRKRYHSEEAVKKAREILLSAEKQVEDYKVKKVFLIILSDEIADKFKFLKTLYSILLKPE